MASSSSWFLRVFILVAAWFSVVMTGASFQQYYYWKGVTDDPESDKMMRLQVPSMFGHPLFALPALLLGHWLAPG